LFGYQVVVFLPLILIACSFIPNLGENQVINQILAPTIPQSYQDGLKNGSIKVTHTIEFDWNIFCCNFVLALAYLY